MFNIVEVEIRNTIQDDKMQIDQPVNVFFDLRLRVSLMQFNENLIFFVFNDDFQNWYFKKLYVI